MSNKIKDLAVNIILFMIIILLTGCCKTHTIVGPVLKTKLANGVYEGRCFKFPNRAVVKVTIKDNKISNIKIVSHWAWRGKKAELPIVKEIIEKQSTKVDAVTGATNSSKAIMEAVQNAVDKANEKYKTSSRKL